MKRRQLLQSLGILGLEPLLFGCQSPPVNQLRIQFLKQSLPTLLISDFRQLVKGDLNASSIAQLADSLKLLQKWSKPTPIERSKNTAADLITLGDSWLSMAIDQKLIKPLNPSKISTWSQLDSKWQQLVTRSGQVWGVPYRWGSVVLLYRRDKFRQAGIKAPTDWADLWRPELKGQISLLNQSQEIIGLTLKHLGHSYNTNPQTVPELPTKLRQLHQQVALYNSDDYLSPLLTGDTWLAMAWSHDVADLMSRFSYLGLAIPQSGTSLWADLWVQPQSTQALPKRPTIEQWIDFCLQPAIANKISLFTNALSPLSIREITPEIVAHSGLNATVFAKGEFLQTLNASQTESYRSLWQAART